MIQKISNVSHDKHIKKRLHFQICRCIVITVLGNQKIFANNLKCHGNSLFKSTVSHENQALQNHVTLVDKTRRLEQSHAPHLHTKPPEKLGLS